MFTSVLLLSTMLFATRLFWGWALLPVLLSLLPSQVTATGTNHTIDDEGGDSLTGLRPVYEPPGAWKQGSKCPGCEVRPNASSTLYGTWHYVSYLASSTQFYTMTVQFIGSALYVYNIVADDAPTELSFYLDGHSVGQFIHHAIPDSVTLRYGVLVYKNESMADALHTFTMRAAGSTESLILFDYIVYTSGGLLPAPYASSAVPVAEVRSIPPLHIVSC